jgi:signal transduction histidine kinase
LTLIVIFIALGVFFIIKLQELRSELETIESTYISLVDKTRQIESYTNQANYLLWEYNELGDDMYYRKSKVCLDHLDEVVSDIDGLIEHSDELAPLENRLKLIKDKIHTFDELIDSTVVTQSNLRSNQQFLKKIRHDFVEKAKLFLYKQEHQLNKSIQKDTFPPDLLAKQHRISRLINLVVDKGNSNLIRAFESQVSGDNSDLDEAFRQFDYIDRLLDEILELTNDTDARQSVAELKTYFENFKSRTWELDNYLQQRRFLLEQRVELAGTVLHEARMMGEQGIHLSEQGMGTGVENFSRLTTFYLFGLLMATLFAVIFAIAITRSITLPVRRSVLFAKEIANGNLDANIDIKPKSDELGILVDSLRVMGDRLQKMIRELKRMERSMVNKIIETEERDRQRFAEDLHDSLGPLLSTIKLYINTIQNENYSDHQQKEMIGKADEMLNESIDTTRQIANNLLPNLLKDFGLNKAIASFCEKIREVNVVDINYQCIHYSNVLDQNAETILYRIVKELINNTMKHAHAERIDIVLDMNDYHVQIDYMDDGIGFDISDLEKDDETHHGIQNICSRVRTMNGTVNFSRRKDHGSQVKIWIPVS